NKNWHGHNYNLYVTIKGEPNPETGFIMNVKELSEIITREILDKLDHKNLNLDVDFLLDILPSTENLCREIWKQLEPHITECKFLPMDIVRSRRKFCALLYSKRIIVRW